MGFGLDGRASRAGASNELGAAWLAFIARILVVGKSWTAPSGSR